MWGSSFIIRDSKLLAERRPERDALTSIGPTNLAEDGLKEQNAMKRVLVTFVLALTTAALGQGSSPSQQPSAQQPAATDQQANTPTNQKVIKDPAEYNAYMTALNTTDPAGKGQAMEAFITQYPNSIVKTEAMEQAMGA